LFFFWFQCYDSHVLLLIKITFYFLFPCLGLQQNDSSIGHNPTQGYLAHARPDPEHHKIAHDAEEARALAKEVKSGKWAGTENIVHTAGDSKGIVGVLEKDWEKKVTGR